MSLTFGCGRPACSPLARALTAVKFTSFATDDECQEVAAYARDLGVLLHEGNMEGQRYVIVTAPGNDRVRAFIVRRAATTRAPPLS